MYFLFVWLVSRTQEGFTPWVLTSVVRRNRTLELELELIQTQMAQKPMLRVEMYARTFCASQNERERASERRYGWARDASDEWAGRGRVREWKALVWGSRRPVSVR